MALVDNAWYSNYGDGSTTGYYAITKWATGATIAAGALRRQNTTPALGSERVFVCVVAGTTHATTEPTWVLTRGAKTTDNTVTWQECSGIAALNGDAANTPSWTITATPPGGVKNTAVVLGQVIKRDNGASYQICTTAGTAGNAAEPSFSDSAGTTTNDNTVVWTSLGVVGNFTAWLAPHARLANALTATWGQAGNTFAVGDNNAEVRAGAFNLNGLGTFSNPCFICCIDHTAILGTAVTTGATIEFTSGGNIQSAGSASNYFDGIAFTIPTGQTVFVGVGGGNLYLTNGGFTASGTGIVDWGNAVDSTITMRNWTNSIAASLRIRASKVRWLGGTLAGSVPTNIFSGGASGQFGPQLVEVRGVDLSVAGSGKTLYTSGAFANSQITLIDCKLGASVTVATIADPGAIVDLIRCDSGATTYRDERYGYSGAQTVETTIVRTGGATDGTTPQSWKIVDTANSKWINPFESQPIAIWNDSTSAITTLTIFGTTTGGGVPNNDDIWVEVEYLGSALTPQGTFITTTKASNLAASAATNNSSDASTWGGGGAGNGFKIVVPSFTPGMKGPINIVVKVAKASTTYYIDPRPSISGVTVSKSEILAPGVYANEISSGTGGGISRARGFGGFS